MPISSVLHYRTANFIKKIFVPKWSRLVYRGTCSTSECTEIDLVSGGVPNWSCTVVLDWIESFLSGRTQQIAYGGQLSTTQHVLFGVPKGSVLGPLLYICVQ